MKKTLLIVLAIALTASACESLIYAHGKGMPKNIPMARKYFQKAADYGNAEAKKNLEALPQE